jgi:CBS domain-containing protein
MVVREIMKTDVATSAPNEALDGVLRTMQTHNCGFAPVVDSAGTVVGVITDRDAGLAMAHHPERPPSRIAVREAMTKPVFGCLPDDNLKRVLATMANHHVRRLPVIDEDGHLRGVLSIDDIVVTERRRGSPTAEEIVGALKMICGPRRIVET